MAAQNRDCVGHATRVNCRKNMASYRALLCIFICASATPLWAAESVPLATQAQSPPALSVQDASGGIKLAARDAITHGTQMHYESAPIKNCLGYWFKTGPAVWSLFATPFLLYADKHFSAQTVEELCRLGHVVITIRKTGGPINLLSVRS